MIDKLNAHQDVHHLAGRELAAALLSGEQQPASACPGRHGNGLQGDVVGTQRPAGPMVPSAAVDDGDAEMLAAFGYTAEGVGVGDPDDQADIDGLVESALNWLDGKDAEPTAGEFTAKFGELVREGANAAVLHAITNRVIERWHANGRSKDRDRVVSTLASVWRREERDQRQLVRAAHDAQAANRQDPNAEPTAEERAAIRAELWSVVKELAMRPNVLELAVQQVVRLGVVGEDDVIRLVYLAGTSRVTHRPVCPLISGASSGGKSYVSQQTLRLFPEEDVITMTTGSALSLVYDQEPIKHRILVVFEATQLQADDQSTFALSLRTLLSEGRIVHKTVVTTPNGDRFTETIIKEGPVTLVITTTSPDIHAENETRMTRLAIHETTEQTAAVMRSIGRQAARGTCSEEGQVMLEPWRALQRWIAAGPRDVVIPYAETLSEKIPPAAVRFRRDMSAILGLIKAHALLHQAQRETTGGGAIVATVEDYAAIRTIGARVLQESAGKRPSDRVIAVVQHVENELAGRLPTAAKPTGIRLGKRTAPVVHGDEYNVSVRVLGELLGIDRKAAEHAVKRALDDGYLANNETIRGKPMRLVLGMRKLSEVGVNLLPEPEELL